ncbi:MAG: DUF3108 domain-containing protein [Elusimicrobia bacterium]|nr:DUF3108 domain-containing protein [Candidatus Liberimonas magnetica]
MLKKCVTALLISVYLILPVFSATQKPQKTHKQNKIKKFVWRQEKNDAFKVGEYLEFDIRYKFVVIGYATMAVKNIEKFQNRDCYHIVTEARTAAFFDHFFKVRDVNESWIDTKSLCSLKFRQQLSEGNYRNTETLIFDQVRHTYYIPETKKIGAIPNWAQDVLSSLYYLRTKNISDGKTISIDANSGGKSWPLSVRILRKEEIKVPAGSFKCYVVEPNIREGTGIFQAKGSLSVWLTDDNKKTPVEMSSEIAIGSIKADLKTIRE